MKRILQTSVATLLVTVWCAAATAQSIPIEDMFAVSDFVQMAISPDGKHYVAHRQQGDQESVAIRQSADSTLTHSFTPEPLMRFHQLIWLNESRVLAQIAYRGTKAPTPLPSSMMLTTDFDGSNNKFQKPVMRLLKKDGTLDLFVRKEIGTYQILSKLPSETQYVRAVKHPWSQDQNSWVDARNFRPVIGLVNTFFGTFSDKEKLPHVGATPYANTKGDVNLMSWRDDQGVLHLAKRSSPDDEWRPVAGINQIAAQALDVAAVNLDTTIVYLLGIRNGDRVRTLYALDIESGDHLPVFEHRRSLASWAADANNDLVIATVDPAANQYLYSKLKPQSRYIALHRKLVAPFANRHVVIVSSDDTQDHVIVQTTSDVDPGTYYLFNNETNQARFIGANRPWLAPENLSQSHVLRIPAEDGDLTIYLHKPNANTTARGVVVYANLKSTPFQPAVQALVQQGYTVLQPDVRSTNVTHSLVAAGQWAIESKVSTTSQMCVLGIGSYVENVIQAALAKPTIYRCVVGIADTHALDLHRKDVQTNNSGDQSSSPSWLFIQGSENATATFTSMAKDLPRERAKLALKKVNGDLNDKQDSKAQVAAYSEVLRFLASELSNNHN